MTQNANLLSGNVILDLYQNVNKEIILNQTNFSF